MSCPVRLREVDFWLEAACSSKKSYINYIYLKVSYINFIYSSFLGYTVKRQKCLDFCPLHSVNLQKNLQMPILLGQEVKKCNFFSNTYLTATVHLVKRTKNELDITIFHVFRGGGGLLFFLFLTYLCRLKILILTPVHCDPPIFDVRC